MRKGLLIPLIISVVFHGVVIGAGQLLYGPEDGAQGRDPAVTYDIPDSGSNERPPGADRAEPADEPAGGSISLETSDPRYRPYFKTLRLSIEKNWRAPAPRKGTAPSGKLVVLFVLGRDGKLLEITVHRSSGVRELDFSAVESIKNAAPFKPFPGDIHEAKLSVKARFVYD